MALFMDEAESADAWKDAGDDPDLVAMKSLMEEPPEETAEIYKEQGNLSLKKGHKFYEEAKDYYTQALGCQGSIAKNNSVYHANRAHVELLLGNHGRALADSLEAMRLDAANIKAYFRAAKAALAMSKFQEAANYAREGLLLQPENADLARILGDAEEKHAKVEAAARKRRRTIENAKAVAQAIAERRIQMGRGAFKEVVGRRKPRLDPETGALRWPLVFVYGEGMSSDVAEDFSEEDKFADQLELMFGEAAPPLDWDTTRQYRLETVELYYEANTVHPFRSENAVLYALLQDEEGLEDFSGRSGDDDAEEERQDWSSGGVKRWVRVHSKETLREVLAQPGCVVPGVPVFYVVAKGTPFRETFLSGQWAPQ
eukprot:TRINITY_DN32769_c0_g1_i1.p1 TRINITY_DN32769_c0_g1~~TRINITY_DN32769_c0_g1_i1.p1  ORF type:complete len:371 (-),score=93.90 TRINITY_DN32769_c0_g1_i1:35-1147(-)